MLLVRVGLLTAVLGMAPGSIVAQDASAPVRAAIERLFLGMKTSDSSMVRSVMHPEVRFLSVSESGGVARLQAAQAEGFIKAVGSPKAPGQDWDERIAGLQIAVDGPLASAWMDYAFYLGGRLSHCGVNAMHLIKTEAGWQIIAIIDTRRQEGCSG